MLPIVEPPGLQQRPVEFVEAEVVLLEAVEPADVGDVVVCWPRVEPGIVQFVAELFHWLEKYIRIFRIMCSNWCRILKLSSNFGCLIPFCYSASLVNTEYRLVRQIKKY